MNDDTRAKLHASLEAHEDRRSVPYNDGSGNIAIGIGHNLLGPGGTIPLTDKAIDAILEGDVDEMIRRCSRRLPFWHTLDDIRQAALVEMAFNGALFASPKMIAALGRGDYEDAEREALDGPWLSQVGERARTIARRLRTGTW